MEDKTKIQYLKDVKRLSFRQIEQEIGISRKRASKIYSGNWRARGAKGLALDAYRDLIAHWFKECPSLKSIQVYQRLKERGVNVSYRAVSQFTRGWRRKKAKTYWPLEFLPGEEGQVDWFFVNHPKLGKLCGFALILSYSRYLFAHLFCRHSFEFFIEGHLMAFQYCNGYPHALRYDNLKSVVLSKQPLQYNPAFLDFAHHYGFEIRLCNLAAGNEKGRVERVIRSLRDTFFNTAEHHLSLKSLNQALHDWVEQKNGTLHRATDQRPVDRKKAEPFKKLPDIPWNNVIIHPPKKTTKTGLVIFDTNSYSVPDYLTGHLLSVHASVDRVEIYDSKSKKIATHPRSFGRCQKILNPAHRSFNKLGATARRERIYAVIKNLNPVVEQFLAQNRHRDEDPYQSAYQLFKLLRLHNRSTLLSAIREALSQKACKMKFIHSLLQPHSSEPMENVAPQNQDLLDIDYQARSLEEYDDNA